MPLEHRRWTRLVWVCWEGAPCKRYCPARCPCISVLVSPSYSQCSQGLLLGLCPSVCSATLQHSCYRPHVLEETRPPCQPLQRPLLPSAALGSRALPRLTSRVCYSCSQRLRPGLQGPLGWFQLPEQGADLVCTAIFLFFLKKLGFAIHSFSRGVLPFLPTFIWLFKNRIRLFLYFLVCVRALFLTVCGRNLRGQVSGLSLPPTVQDPKAWLQAPLPGEVSQLPAFPDFIL